MWDKVPPPPEALASEQPFSIDTLTLPQWLQFIFLPTLYRLLDEGQPLPGRCTWRLVTPWTGALLASPSGWPLWRRSPLAGMEPPRVRP